MARRYPDLVGRHLVVETRTQRVHLAPSILADDSPDRIDPDRWRPFIVSFQRFYGLTPTELSPSTLAEIPEAFHRSPDVGRSQQVVRRSRYTNSPEEF